MQLQQQKRVIKITPMLIIIVLKATQGKVVEKAAVMEVGNKLIKPSNSNSLSL